MAIEYRKQTYDYGSIYSFYGGSGSPSNFDFSKTVTAWNDWKNRASNPYYKTQIKLHLNAALPYSRLLTGGHLEEGSFVHLRSSWPVPFYNSEGYEVGRFQNAVPWAPAEASDSSQQDIALAKLKSKLHKAVGDKNALVPLLELRELRHLVSSSTRLTRELLGSILNRLRRGHHRGRGSAGFIAWLADSWLTWSFGINPTIQDIKEILKAIEHFNKRNRFLRVTGSAGTNWTERKYFGPGIICQTAQSYVTFRAEHRLDYRYVSGVDLFVHSANDYGLYADHLHLFDPAAWVPTLYELIPYSWLLDYFTTTGDVINDIFWTLPGNTRYIVLCKRHECRVSSTTKVVPVKTYAGHPVTSQWAVTEWGYRLVRFQRTVPLAVPHRILRFRTLDELGYHSIQKVLNIASLIVSHNK